MAGFGRIFGVTNASTNYRGILSISNVRNINGNVSLMGQSKSRVQKISEKLGIPPRPKRAMTPFFKFLMIERPKVIANNPNLKYRDVLKVVATEWLNVSPEEKSILREQYDKEKLTYTKAFKEYEETLTSEQRTSLKGAIETKKDHRQKLAFKNKVLQLGKPKKPPSSFFLFVADMQPLKKDDETQIEWVRNMSQKWQSMSPDEKKKYNDKSQESLERYRDELQAWEEKMVRMGHIDVVQIIGDAHHKSKRE